MVPAEPLNPSASQSMLPGLGVVRSGNGFNDNALQAREGRQFAQQVNKRRAWAGKQQDIGQLKRMLVGIEAKLQSASATGVAIPAKELRQLQTMKKKILTKITEIGRTDNQAGGTVLPPWQRAQKVKSAQMVQHRSLPTVRGPATPDPLKEASYAFSSQRNRPQIRDMQANIQPVVSMRQMQFAERARAASMDGFTDWFGGELIPNVPNWAMATGGGVLLLLLMKRRRRTRA